MVWCENTELLGGVMRKQRNIRWYVGAVEEIMCVMCVSVTNSGHGCDLVPPLCRNDLRKGDLFVLSWVSEAGKYRFRATNVWWRCAQYFAIVIALVARCLDRIDVCLLFFMSGVVTVVTLEG